MAEFPTAVSPPGGMSYAAPLLSFQNFSNWAADDPYKKIRDQQQQQLNQQRLTQGQQQIDLAKAFPNGLPKDSSGAIDYPQIAQTMARFGDVAGAMTVLQQQPPPQSAMLSGGGQPGQPPAQGAAQPASIPARPLPAPAANSPQGDPGTGTIADIVTARMPAEDLTTGQTIGKIAKLIGVDPNATLTAGQRLRAEGLLRKYAGSDAAPAAGGTGDSVPGAPLTFRDRLAGDGGGNLPPSAIAGSPPPSAAPAGPSPAQPQQPAQAQPAPVAGPGAPQAPGQPQPPQGGPIVPQVPLPKGFTDPQQAILALRAEAARLGSNPKAREQVAQLVNYAQRIEDSIKPVEMSPGKTLLDPKTGQPIYQGAQQNLQGAALDAAAERYLQTGQFPPNTGRGVQGTADRNAILNQASALAAARGIDQADLPKKWQEFKAQQVAIQRFQSGPQGNTIKSFNVLVDHLDTLREAGAALKNGDIRIFNQWRQNWATQTGESAPTSFDGVKALVGDEIVKAVVGSAGALADREEVKKDLDRVSSPKQLADLIDKYDKLALGQLKGLRKQYEVSTGLKNFGDLLLPGTLSALGGNKGQGSAPDSDGWITMPNGARVQEVK